VSENRVLTRIFGSERAKVAGGCRKLRNEGFHNLYSSPNIRVIKSRSSRWARHVARMGETRNAYKTLVRKTEGKTQLRRTRCRWEDNNIMDLRERWCPVVDWKCLTQDRD
jgi:hypothetical protein